MDCCRGERLCIHNGWDPCKYRRRTAQINTLKSHCQRRLHLKKIYSNNKNKWNHRNNNMSNTSIRSLQNGSGQFKLKWIAMCSHTKHIHNEYTSTHTWQCISINFDYPFKSFKRKKNWSDAAVKVCARRCVRTATEPCLLDTQSFKLPKLNVQHLHISSTSNKWDPKQVNNILSFLMRRFVSVSLVRSYQITQIHML